MHICTVATLCFPEKTVPRNYYYCVQDDNSLCLCFKSMYRTLFVAIFTSTFIFSMSKSSHTYRNINISNHIPNHHRLLLILRMEIRPNFSAKLMSNFLSCKCLGKLRTYSLACGVTALLKYEKLEGL